MLDCSMITPQTKTQKLAQAIGLTVDLYLKREDLHPYGSHKGRSIPFMIEHYVKENHKTFCISSSGNAALAAARFIKKYNRAHKTAYLTLTVFIGKNIEKQKLQAITKLIDQHITLEKTDNPKQSAFKMDKNKLAKNLRQSTDDTALTGYAELARELTLIKNVSAIFIPTSSGTTAQALQQQFSALGLQPQIHIVQTTSCHPMAIAAQNIQTNEASIASAIVDKVAFRKEKVLKGIKKSKGAAWVADNQEIKQAIKLIKKTQRLEVSTNSALSVAGLTQAIKNNWKFSGAVVCLITGK
jgi:threonine synthase